MTFIKNSRLKIFLSVAVLFTAIFAFFIFVPEAFAEDVALEATGTAAGLGETDLATTIGRIIGIFLGTLGIILLGMVLYSGYLFMTAAGDADRLEKAKKTLTNAIIGLIITMSAYAITSFVVQSITGEGIFGGGGDTTSDGTISVEPYSGSLGAGIRDHFPERNASDVARNTKIFVTFAEAMDIESIIDGYDTAGTPLDVSDDTIADALNDRFIKIYETASGDGEAFGSDEIIVTFSDDLKTFVFTPPVLGSEVADVQYTVSLDDNLETADGEQILNSGGYEWSFTVGTELDLDPPTVKRVTPAAGASYDRNIVVQITFSEAVDLTSASGLHDPENGLIFDNILVSGAESGAVPGEYIISNEYKTVTFVPSDPCGINSCGETLYCLSAADAMTVLIKDLVTDVAGNALDGDSNGLAGGEHTWSFTTTGEIRLGGPTILTIAPDIEASDVALDQDVVISFDSELMSSSISSANFNITSNPSHEMWMKPRSEFTIDGTIVTLKHGVFLETTPDQTFQYGVVVTEGLRDEYQNCFSPAYGPGKSGICGTDSSAPYCCDGLPQSTACSLF